MVRFEHFDLEMRFALQRRTFFRNLIFLTCSDTEMFCICWLPNVLRGTTASILRRLNFQTCSDTGVLYILTWKRASRHNGVHLFISHLTTWLRTRRFSEPIFRPSGATNYWKNTVFRGLPTFSCDCIFFFWLFLWLFPPLPVHLSMVPEVWLLNFLRLFSLRHVFLCFLGNHGHLAYQDHWRLPETKRVFDNFKNRPQGEVANTPLGMIWMPVPHVALGREAGWLCPFIAANSKDKGKKSYKEKKKGKDKKSRGSTRSSASGRSSSSSPASRGTQEVQPQAVERGRQRYAPGSSWQDAQELLHAVVSGSCHIGSGC